MLHKDYSIAVGNSVKILNQLLTYSLVTIIFKYVDNYSISDISDLANPEPNQSQTLFNRTTPIACFITERKRNILIEW